MQIKNTYVRDSMNRINNKNFKASLLLGEPVRCGGFPRCSNWRERFGEGFLVFFTDFPNNL